MKKIIAYSSVLFILFAGCTFAASTSTKSEMTPAKMCVNYDKLTKTQKADVDKMIKDTMDQMMPKRQELMSKYEMLRTQMMQTPIDESAINKTAKEITSLKSDLMMMHIQAMTQITKKYGYIPLCCTMKGHCAKMKDMMMDGEMPGAMCSKK
jgi:hypothetical protein